MASESRARHALGRRKGENPARLHSARGEQAGADGVFPNQGASLLQPCLLENRSVPKVWGGTAIARLLGTAIPQRVSYPNLKKYGRRLASWQPSRFNRSPTGTGVSGRAAVHHARGELGDEWIRIESILGTSFEVRVAEVDPAGGKTIVPEVRGRAHITGKAEFWMDPRDPLRDGFVMR